jgi:hypothetical protein
VAVASGDPGPVTANVRPVPADDDLDRFRRPPLGWYVLNDGGVIALFTLSLSARAHTAVARRLPVPTRRTVQRLSLGVIALHAAEAAAAARLVRARHLERSGRRWILHTLVVGFPALRSLRSTTAPGASGR